MLKKGINNLLFLAHKLFAFFQTIRFALDINHSTVMGVVALSRLLGHAAPSITLDKYGHALSEHKGASVEKLGGVYRAGRSYSRER